MSLAWLPTTLARTLGDEIVVTVVAAVIAIAFIMGRTRGLSLRTRFDRVTDMVAVMLGVSLLIPLQAFLFGGVLGLK